MLLDCLPPPPRPHSAYEFVKLEPQQFHGVRDVFEIKDVIDKPGEYDIEVTFNSFLSNSFVKQYFADDAIARLPLWTSDGPPVAAPLLHVVIIP